MINNTKHNNQGFTLIELTLAMAFIAILLLSILYTTLHTGKLYTKGITSKTLNQIGREVTDTIRRDFVSTDSSRVLSPEPSGAGDAKSGRLCLGTATYVWNTATLLNSDATKLEYENGGLTTPVTLRRVLDSDGLLCQKDGMGKYVVTEIPSSMQSADMLSGVGQDFAVYDLQFDRLGEKGGQGLYAMKLVIGTNAKNTTETDVTSTEVCKPPTDNEADFEYCSIAEFDIVLRAGGGQDDK